MSSYEVFKYLDTKMAYIFEKAEVNFLRVYKALLEREYQTSYIFF